MAKASGEGRICCEAGILQSDMGSGDSQRDQGNGYGKHLVKNTTTKVYGPCGSNPAPFSCCMQSIQLGPIARNHVADDAHPRELLGTTSMCQVPALDTRSLRERLTKPERNRCNKQNLPAGRFDCTYLCQLAPLVPSFTPFAFCCRRRHYCCIMQLALVSLLLLLLPMLAYLVGWGTIATASRPPGKSIIDLQFNHE
jgi:hypothetical protein